MIRHFLKRKHLPVQLCLLAFNHPTATRDDPPKRKPDGAEHLSNAAPCEAVEKYATVAEISH